VTPEGFGPGQTQNVFYTNQAPQMRASLLWFHDHGLGTTRLNVFAGLAAAYILRDEFDTGEEPNPIGIPGGAYEIPLVIQDRQFNADGTFLYSVSDIPGVTWIGEYFGDVMLVNGKVWPFLDVEPRLYRFRILNGCNARILSLDLAGLDMWQIGAEGGMFDVSVPVRELLLAPAERADIVVDFSRASGTTLVMRNHAPRKPVRRRGLRGCVRRSERCSRRNRSDPIRHRPDGSSKTRGARLQGHGKSRSRLLHDDKGQVRPADRRDGAAALCLSLSHRGARGQRHDAAVHRRVAKVGGQAADAPAPDFNPGSAPDGNAPRLAR
jgi:FtsP/CotA-like multicopper oxidase with cupredoxin domain